MVSSLSGTSSTWTTTAVMLSGPPLPFAIDQVLDAALRPIFEHDARNLGLGDVAVQTVAAEEDAVAGAHVFDEEVGGDLGLGAKAAGDDIALGVVAGLFLSEDARADLLSHPGMVARDLAKGAVAQDVGAAIADVDEEGARPDEDDGHASGAHAAVVGVVAGVAIDGDIGLADSAGQGGEGVVVGRFVVFVADGVDADVAGDLAGGIAAHAVADDEERAAPFELGWSVRDNVKDIVLVAFALAADVGQLRDGKAELVGQTSPSCQSARLAVTSRTILHRRA